MFHVELRQFPRNTHAFNLSDVELRTSVLTPWAQGRVFELAGAKFRPDEARLTILEGPPLESHELAMGRGWANARKRGREVTREVLAGGRGGVDAGAGDERYAGFRAELAARVEQAPTSPHEAWRLATRWFPGRPVSERLAVSERASRELLADGSCKLGRGTPAGAAGHPVPADEVDLILLAWETWAEPQSGVFLTVAPR